jgi:hypothetical protein
VRTRRGRDCTGGAWARARHRLFDRNLLFGVLALQADLLDNDRFAEACTLWASYKQTPLADLLVGRGWLTPEERGHVEFLLGRKLQKHRGDARASLAWWATSWRA